MNPSKESARRPAAPAASMGWAAGLAAALAAMLAGCSPGIDGPTPLDSSPSTVMVSPGFQSSPPATGPAASVPPSAATPTLLPPAVQAELDQRLVAATKANNLTLAAELIQAGANVNAKDAIEDSAFLYAGAEGLNDMLRLTLAHGADVGSTNRFGGTALIPASEHGHVETVRILIAAGVPVNHVNKLGWTAMQEAILLNNGGPRQQEVVRLLLAAGADPGIRDPQGRTALQNAERLGFDAIAKLIREQSQPT